MLRTGALLQDMDKIVLKVELGSNSIGSIRMLSRDLTLEGLLRAGPGPELCQGQTSERLKMPDV